MSESDLEKRLSAIESRLSALEKRRPASVSAKPCKRCGSHEREFVSSTKHPHFGPFGDTVDIFRCSTCGLQVEEHVKNRG